MRENLGKELSKSAQQAARRVAPGLIRVAAGQVKDVAKNPSTVFGSEQTSAPPLNEYRGLSAKPLAAGTLALVNRSNGTEYVSGTDFVEDAAGGRFQNLMIPSGTSLDALYHYYKGSGGGVTDHGALTGLADDDHPQYHTDARGDARYPRGDPSAPSDGYVWTYDSVSGGWLPEALPAAPVDSVDGRTGTVSLTDLYTAASHATDTANPHSVTAAQAGAAPLSHVGSTDGHPAATVSAAGFMAAADKVIVDEQATGFFALATDLGTTLSDGVATRVALGSTRYATKGSVDLTNDRWTADKNEVLMIGAFVQLYFRDVSDGSNLSILIYKNGTSYARIGQAHTGSTRGFGVSGSAPVDVVAGDYIELFAQYYTAGIAARVTGESNFWAYK